ncbi:hypothetical protein LPA04_08370 [Lacticaseibacillus paracasei subsp. paracasei]|nr:hypothetical protein LPA04_08370 [Lacticaseibacillus paracasei subsp. paracasei]
MTCFCADVVVWPYELALPAVLAEALDLVALAVSVLEDPLALEERLVVVAFPVALLVLDLLEAFDPLPITHPCLTSVLDFACLPFSVLVLDSSDP